MERSSRDVVARLGKGRAYARDGHVHGLKIFPGKVTATVTDDELDSYAVSLNLDVFEPKVWNQILQAMSQQALFAAQLLNGEMPKDADRLFRSCGKSLFPANSHDIDADCSCDDWSSPCKHVAATHYVLGEALDRDPFLLFELRGRSKEQVLAGLNQLRAHSGSQDASPAAVTTDLPVAASHVVALQSLAVQNFESGATALPAMSFNFDSVPVSGALLRSLGKPSSWPVHETPQDLLGPALLHARQLAVELATSSGTLPIARAPLQSGKTGSKATLARKPRTQRKIL
ncbi:MAG: hypothetical protein EPO09_21390 [Aquabacterium sp.]|uniref:hypothetical protein n=1 Tax=Aquabacterium sp. TaxID=1872578 RepID=UPI00120FDE8B|nr:hypothetical protein [Aquabacterium sp.]TAK83146.1 MAG: hypothetical protein EPO09_21390 [Aquabacterium sp.]